MSPSDRKELIELVYEYYQYDDEAEDAESFAWDLDQDSEECEELMEEAQHAHNARDYAYDCIESKCGELGIEVDEAFELINKDS